RLAPRRERVDHLVDRARRDASLERRRLDAALAQREVVGEHADVGPEELIEGGILRAGTGRHHSVLDDEEGDLAAGFAELSRKAVELSDVSRFPGTLGLDQHILAHARALLFHWVALAFHGSALDGKARILPVEHPSLQVPDLLETKSGEEGRGGRAADAGA